MTGSRYEDRGSTPGPGGEPYPGAAGGTGAGPEPPDAVPTERVPTERVPPETVPTETVPTETVPTETVPTERVPPRTRVSGIWVASIAAVVVLLVLLIFILQNGASVKINIFGANPTLPIGVALLLAAVLGALLVALVGAARVVQLRRTTRKMARNTR